MKVIVTERDIKGANRCNSMRCPIARALHRAGKKDWSVGSDECGDAEISVPLPKKAQKFIADFDNQQPVKPFSFNLRIPA